MADLTLDGLADALRNADLLDDWQTFDSLIAELRTRTAPAPAGTHPSSPQGQPVTAEDIALIENRMNAYDKLADEFGALACGQAEARERETADSYRRILAALRGSGQTSEGALDKQGIIAALGLDFDLGGYDGMFGVSAEEIADVLLGAGLRVYPALSAPPAPSDTTEA